MDKVIEKWDEILQTVKRDYNISDVAFNTWLKPLEVYDVTDNVITILVPSEQVVLINLLNKKYKLLLQVTICELTGISECDVKFISPDEAPQKDVPSYDNAAPAMKTLDKAEFHSPVMQAGSTGTYSDMTGGHTFTQYDCGHEYNDEIVPQSQTGGKVILDDIKFDKNEMRKAFVMQEILKRKVI